MGIKVNPPPLVKIPEKFLLDKETRIWFLNDQEFKYKMWLRSGGGTDTISTIVIESADNAQIEDLIPTSAAIQFYSSVKTSNYTAVHGDFIEAQSGAIITLDPNADIDDQIIVANGDGTSITVLGDIKFNRLDTKLFLRNQGSSMYFQYFGDYWRIR